MADGFGSYEGNAVRWVASHVGGSTFVYAPSKEIALQRFMAKYPEKKVRDIKRA